jgi:hypothetical protein
MPEKHLLSCFSNVISHLLNSMRKKNFLSYVCLHFRKPSLLLHATPKPQARKRSVTFEPVDVAEIKQALQNQHEQEVRSLFKANSILLIVICSMFRTKAHLTLQNQHEQEIR